MRYMDRPSLGEVPDGMTARAMMAAGLFMFLIGVFLAVWRAFRARARERLVGSIVIAEAIQASEVATARLTFSVSTR